MHQIASMLGYTTQHTTENALVKLDWAVPNHSHHSANAFSSSGAGHTVEYRARLTERSSSSDSSPCREKCMNHFASISGVIVLTAVLGGCTAVSHDADAPDSTIEPGLKALTPAQVQKIRPSPASAAENRGGGWCAACYDGWTGPKRRFQDSAERDGRSHECGRHMCAHTTWVEWCP